MDVVIALISLVLFFAFIIGLIKPAIVRMPSRGRSTLIYLGGSIMLACIGSILYPTERNTPVKKDVVSEEIKTPVKNEFVHSDETLAEYLKENKVARREVVNGYVNFKSLPANATDGFYNCMSEMAFTKSRELKVGDVLEWCKADYDKDPSSLNNKINFDNFEDNFSGWDGSYRPLEKIIKSSMNDDSSYKHVSTTYRLILGKDPYAVVETIIRGTNAFGGVVKQVVAARVDVRTGEVVSILKD